MPFLFNGLGFSPVEQYFRFPSDVKHDIRHIETKSNLSNENDIRVYEKKKLTYAIRTLGFAKMQKKYHKSVEKTILHISFV